MRKLLVFFAVIIVSLSVNAVEIGSLNALRSYSQFLGCSSSVDPYSMLKVDIDGDKINDIIAIISLDKDCTGIPSNIRQELLILFGVPGESNTFVARPEWSRFVNMPPMIDKLYLKNGQLWIEGRFRTAKDGDGPPSFQVKSPLTLEKASTPHPSGNGSSITWIYWRPVIDFQTMIDQLGNSTDKIVPTSKKPLYYSPGN